LEPKQPKQQIEGQKKSFDEQNFYLGKKRNKRKRQKTKELKSKKFSNPPLLHMQFIGTQDL
jgi:hypothetical protein